MKPANQYQVNFPYGATSAPYSVAHPHRGDDRPCPTGTPIIIGEVTIGLTGATGQVTGPHLHIQEWQGNEANTRKPQNAFLVGTVINIDPTGTQGDGSFGKFITIQTSDGWNDSYCHLSQINVKIGDILGGDMIETESQNDLIFLVGVSRHAGDSEKGRYIGKTFDYALNDILKNADRLKQDSILQNANKTTTLTAGNYKVV